MAPTVAIEDVDTPRSPGWWFRKLAKAHRDRYGRLSDLWDRHQGRPPLPELPNPKATQNQRQAWNAVQRRARTNYAELVVEAVRERMTPVNFAVADDRELTDLGRRYWAENEMPVQFPDILEQMLALSIGYGVVGPPRQGSDVPVISAEDWREFVAIQDPEDPTRTLAALKVFHDELEERDVAYLYLEAETVGAGARVLRATRKGRGSVLQRGLVFTPRAWTFDDTETRLPIDDLPIVAFVNRRGVGEFELHIDHLDRINHTLLNRITITTMQAFRQRALKGAPDRDPATGEEIDYNERLPADPAALWLLPATVDVWESSSVDLTPVLSAVKDDVRDLSAVTRVPIFYFQPDAANGSATGASLAREGLVFRTEDRTIRAGSAAARLQRFALRIGQATARGKPLIVTTEWAPVERLSLAERYDAASKAPQAGVPWETRMRTILGFGPEDIARMRRERIEDALFEPTGGAGDPTQGAIVPTRTAPGTGEDLTRDTGAGSSSDFTAGAAASAPSSAGQTGAPAGTTGGT